MVSDIFQIFDTNNIFVDILEPFFLFLENLFGSAFVILFSLILVYVILFIILSYFIVIYVNQRERKINNKKYIFVIDIILFVLIFLCSFRELYFWSDRFIAIYKRDLNYSDWLIYLRCIGVACSFFYSLVMNFRILKKYLEKINMLKYKETIFKIILFIFIILFSYFFYLPFNYNKNIEIVETYEATSLEEDNEVDIIETYYKMSNGQYKIKGFDFTYNYRIELAEENQDFIFIVLTNRKEITYEEVLLSSPAYADICNTLNEEESVLIGLKLNPNRYRKN